MLRRKAGQRLRPEAPALGDDDHVSVGDFRLIHALSKEKLIGCAETQQRHQRPLKGPELQDRDDGHQSGVVGCLGTTQATIQRVDFNVLVREKAQVFGREIEARIAVPRYFRKRAARESVSRSVRAASMPRGSLATSSRVASGCVDNSSFRSIDAHFFDQQANLIDDANSVRAGRHKIDGCKSVSA